MTYERRLLQSLLLELEQKRIRTDAEAVRRRNEIYAALPEIAEIDAKLQNTVLEVVKHAFHHGSDVTEPLTKVREQNLALQRDRAELLTRAGYPADYTEPHYDCAVCSDTGYVGQKVCACLDRLYREALVQELSESVGMGVAGFESVRLDLYSDLKRGDQPSPREQMTEVVTFCKNYAKNFGKNAPNLLMTGDTGCGKTLLSAALAHEVVKTGTSVVFDTAFHIFSRFEEERFGRASEEDGSTRRYYEADLLIIDDLGGEMVTQYSTAALGDLIASRELRGKPTVINTALSREELCAKYKRQLAARIEGGFVKVPLFSQDNRGK